MEDDERKQKLQAGKERLAAFQKKRAKKKKKHPSSATVGGEESDSRLSECSSVDTNNEFSVSPAPSLSCEESDQSITSGDEQSGEEPDSRRAFEAARQDLRFAVDHIAELEESLMGKQFALDRVVQENEELRSASLRVNQSQDQDERPPFVSETEIVSVNRQEELSAAAGQEELSAPDQEDPYSAETHELLQQVQILQLQLQQAGQTLHLQMSQHQFSAQALLEAKNEMLTLQGNLAQKDRLLVQTSRELSHKTERCQSLEQSFETLKQRERQSGEVVKQLMMDVETSQKGGAGRVGGGPIIRPETPDMLSLSEHQDALAKQRNDLDEMYGNQIVLMKEQLRERQQEEVTQLHEDLELLEEENKYLKLTLDKRADSGMLAAPSDDVSAKLKAENESFQKQVDDLKNKINTQQGYVASLTEEMKSIDNENEDYRKQIQDFTEQIILQQTDIEHLEEQLDVVSLENNAKSSLIQNLETELASSKQEMLSYQRRISDMDSEIVILKFHIQSFQDVERIDQNSLLKMSAVEKQRLPEAVDTSTSIQSKDNDLISGGQVLENNEHLSQENQSLKGEMAELRQQLENLRCNNFYGANSSALASVAYQVQQEGISFAGVQTQSTAPGEFEHVIQYLVAECDPVNMVTTESADRSHSASLMSADVYPHSADLTIPLSQNVVDVDSSSSGRPGAVPQAAVEGAHVDSATVISWQGKVKMLVAENEGLKRALGQIQSVAVQKDADVEVCESERIDMPCDMSNSVAEDGYIGLVQSSDSTNSGAVTRTSADDFIAKRETVEELEEKIVSLTKELEAVRTDLDVQCSNVDKLQMYAKSLESNASDNERLKHELRALTKSESDLFEQNRVLEEISQKNKLELYHLLADIDKLVEENWSSKTKVEYLKGHLGDIVQKEEVMTQLNVRLDQEEMKVHSLEVQVEVLANEKKNLEQQLEFFSVVPEEQAPKTENFSETISPAPGKSDQEFSHQRDKTVSSEESGNAENIQKSGYRSTGSVPDLPEEAVVAEPRHLVAEARVIMEHLDASSAAVIQMDSHLSISTASLVECTMQPQDPTITHTTSNSGTIMPDPEQQCLVQNDSSYPDQTRVEQLTVSSEISTNICQEDEKTGFINDIQSKLQELESLNAQLKQEKDTVLTDLQTLVTNVEILKAEDAMKEAERERLEQEVLSLITAGEEWSSLGAQKDRICEELQHLVDNLRSEIIAVQEDNCRMQQESSQERTSFIGQIDILKSEHESQQAEEYSIRSQVSHTMDTMTEGEYLTLSEVVKLAMDIKSSEIIGLKSELERLENKWQENEDEVEEFRSSLKDTAEENHQLSKELLSVRQTSNEEISTLRNELGDAERKIHELKYQFETMQSLMKNMNLERESWVKSEASRGDSLEDLQDLQYRLTEVQSENEFLKGDLERTKSELTVMEANLVTSQEENSLQCSQIACVQELEDRLTEAQDENQLLKNNFHRIQEENVELLASISTLERKYAEAVEVIEKSRRQCNILESNCEALQLEREKHISDLSELEDKLALAEQFSEEIENRLSETKMEQDSSEHSRSALQASLERIKTLEIQIDEARKEQDRMAEQIRQLQTEKENSVSRARDFEEKIVKLEQELHLKQTELLDLVHQREGQVKEAEANNQRLERELTDTVEKSNASEKSLLETRTDLTATISDRDELAGRLVEQQAENERLRAAEDINQKLALKLEEMQLKMEAAKLKYDELDQENLRLIDVGSAGETCNQELEQKLELTDSEFENAKCEIAALNEKLTQFEHLASVLQTQLDETENRFKVESEQKRELTDVELENTKAEVGKLKEELCQNEQQVSALKIQFENAKGEIVELNGKLSQFEYHTALLQTQLDETEDLSRSESEQKQELMDAELDQTKDKLVLCTEELVKTKDELVQRTEELRQTEEQVSTLKTQLTKKEEDNMNLKEGITELLKKAEIFQEEFSEAGKDYSRTSEELKDLQIQHELLQAEREHLLKDLQTSRSELENLMSRLSKSDAENSDLNSQLDKLQIDRETVQCENANLKSITDLSNQEISALKASFSSLTAERDSLSSVLEEERQTYDTLSEKFAGVSLDFSNVSSTKQELDRKVLDLEDEIAMLTTAIEEERFSKRCMQAELHEIQQHLSELRLEKEQLVQHQTVSTEEYERGIVSLQEELEKSKSKGDQLVEEVTYLKGKSQELDTKYQTLKAELEYCRAQHESILENVQRENNAQAQLVDQLEHQLSEKREAVIRTDSLEQVTSLRDENQRLGSNYRSIKAELEYCRSQNEGILDDIQQKFDDQSQILAEREQQLTELKVEIQQLRRNEVVSVAPNSSEDWLEPSSLSDELTYLRGENQKLSMNYQSLKGELEYCRSQHEGVLESIQQEFEAQSQILQEREQDNERLRDQNVRINDTLAQQAKDLRRLGTEREKMEMEFVHETAKLEDEINCLKRQLQEMMTKLKFEEDQVQCLQSQIQVLDTTAEALRMDNKTLLDDKDALVCKVDALRTMHSDEISALQQTSESSSRNLDGQMINLQTELTHLKDDLVSMQAKNVEVTNELEDAHRQNTVFCEEKEKLTVEHSKLTLHLENLCVQLEDLEIEKKQLEEGHLKLAQDSEKAVSKLYDEKTRLLDEADEIKLSKHTEVVKVRELEEELAHLKEQLTSASRKDGLQVAHITISDTELHDEHVKKKTEFLEQEHGDLQSELAYLNQLLDDIRSENIALKNEIYQLKGRLRAYEDGQPEAGADSLEMELSKVIEERDRLKHENTSAEDQFQKLLAEYQTDVEALKLRENKLGDELEMATRKLKSFEKENQRLQEMNHSFAETAVKLRMIQDEDGSQTSTEVEELDNESEADDELESMDTMKLADLDSETRVLTIEREPVSVEVEKMSLCEILQEEDAEIQAQYKAMLEEPVPSKESSGIIYTEEEYEEKLKSLAAKFETELQSKEELIMDHHAIEMKRMRIEFEYDLQKEKERYEEEVNMLLVQKIESIKCEKERQFVEELRKARAEIEKACRQGGGGSDTRRSEMISLPQHLQESGFDEDSGDNLSALVERLRRENQELAEARDALLTQLDQSHQKHWAMEEMLQLVGGPATAPVDTFAAESDATSAHSGQDVSMDTGLVTLPSHFEPEMDSLNLMESCPKRASEWQPEHDSFELEAALQQSESHSTSWQPLVSTPGCGEYPEYPDWQTDTGEKDSLEYDFERRYHKLQSEHDQLLVRANELEEQVYKKAPVTSPKTPQAGQETEHQVLQLKLENETLEQKVKEQQELFMVEKCDLLQRYNELKNELESIRLSKEHLEQELVSVAEELEQTRPDRVANVSMNSASSDGVHVAGEGISADVDNIELQDKLSSESVYRAQLESRVDQLLENTRQYQDVIVQLKEQIHQLRNSDVVSQLSDEVTQQEKLQDDLLEEIKRCNVENQSLRAYIRGLETRLTQIETRSNEQLRKPPLVEKAVGKECKSLDSVESKEGSHFIDSLDSSHSPKKLRKLRGLDGLEVEQIETEDETRSLDSLDDVPSLTEQLTSDKQIIVQSTIVNVSTETERLPSTNVQTVVDSTVVNASTETETSSEVHLPKSHARESMLPLQEKVYQLEMEKILLKAEVTKLKEELVLERQYQDRGDSCEDERISSWVLQSSGRYDTHDPMDNEARSYRPHCANPLSSTPARRKPETNSMVESSSTLTSHSEGSLENLLDARFREKTASRYSTMKVTSHVSNNNPTVAMDDSPVVSDHEQEEEEERISNMASIDVDDEHDDLRMSKVRPFDLVDELAELRTEMKETKDIYVRENALLQEALDREKTNKDDVISRMETSGVSSEDNFSMDVVELRQKLAIANQTNKYLVRENEEWIRRVKQQEAFVIELQDRLHGTSRVGDVNIHEILGRQLAILQQHRDELMRKVEEKLSGEKQLSQVLGEMSILEENLRREKELIAEKMVEINVLESELVDQKVELERTAQEQRFLEEKLYQKDKTEKQLMRQKRMLEEELYEIESKLREREAALEFEKNKLLRELKEKDLTIRRYEARHNSANSSLNLSGQASPRLSASLTSLSVASSHSSTASADPARLRRMELVREEIEQKHRDAVDILRHRLGVDHSVEELRLREQHASDLVTLNSRHNKQLESVKSEYELTINRLHEHQAMEQGGGPMAQEARQGAEPGMSLTLQQKHLQRLESIRSCLPSKQAEELDSLLTTIDHDHLRDMEILRHKLSEDVVLQLHAMRISVEQVQASRQQLMEAELERQHLLDLANQKEELNRQFSEKIEHLETTWSERMDALQTHFTDTTELTALTMQQPEAPLAETTPRAPVEVKAEVPEWEIQIDDDDFSDMSGDIQVPSAREEAILHKLLKVDRDGQTVEEQANDLQIGEKVPAELETSQEESYDLDTSKDVSYDLETSKGEPCDLETIDAQTGDFEAVHVRMVSQVQTSCPVSSDDHGDGFSEDSGQRILELTETISQFENRLKEFDLLKEALNESKLQVKEMADMVSAKDRILAQLEEQGQALPSDPLLVEGLEEKDRRLAQLSEDAKTRDRQIRDLEEEITQYKNRQKEFDLVKESLEESDKQVKELVEIVNSKDEILLQLEEKGQVDSLMSEYQDKIKSAEDRVSSLEQELEDRERENAELSEKLQIQQKLYGELEEICKSQESSQKEHQQKVDQLSTYLESKESAIKQLELKLSESCSQSDFNDSELGGTSDLNDSDLHLSDSDPGQKSSRDSKEMEAQHAQETEEMTQMYQEELEKLRDTLKLSRAKEMELHDQVEELTHQYQQGLDALREELQHEQKVEVETMQSEFNVQMDVEIKRCIAELSASHQGEVEKLHCDYKASLAELETKLSALENRSKFNGDSDSPEMDSEIKKDSSETLRENIRTELNESHEKRIYELTLEWDERLEKVRLELEEKFEDEKEELDRKQRQEVNNLQIQLKDTQDKMSALIEALDAGDFDSPALQEYKHSLQEKVDLELEMAKKILQDEYDEQTTSLEEYTADETAKSQAEFMEKHKNMMDDFMAEREKDEIEIRRRHEQELKDLEERLTQQVQHDTIQVSKVTVVTSAPETENEASQSQKEVYLERSKVEKLEEELKEVKDLLQQKDVELADKISELEERHLKEVKSLQSEYEDKLTKVHEDLALSHSDQLAAVTMDTDEVKTDLDLAHQQELADLQERLSEKHGKEVCNLEKQCKSKMEDLVESNKEEISALKKEHETEMKSLREERKEEICEEPMEIATSLSAALETSPLSEHSIADSDDVEIEYESSFVDEQESGGSDVDGDIPDRSGTPEQMIQTLGFEEASKLPGMLSLDIMNETVSADEVIEEEIAEEIIESYLEEEIIPQLTLNQSQTPSPGTFAYSQGIDSTSPTASTGAEDNPRVKQQDEVEQLQGEVERRQGEVEWLQRQLLHQSNQHEELRLRLQHYDHLQGDSLVDMLRSDSDRLGQERDTTQKANDHLLHLLSNSLKLYLTTEDKINKSLTRVVSMNSFDSMNRAEVPEMSQDQSSENQNVSGRPGFVTYDSTQTSDPGQTTFDDGAANQRIASPVPHSQTGSDDRDRDSLDSDAGKNTSLMSMLTDEGLDLSNRVSESIFVGPDLDPEGEELLRDGSSRLQGSVSRLLEMMGEGHEQLLEARRTHQGLLDALTAKTEEVEQVKERCQDLDERLGEEVAAKEYLALELHKAEGLIEGYVAEKSALQHHLDETEEKEIVLVMELETVRNKLHDLESSQVEVASIRQEVEHQQETLHANLGQESQDFTQDSSVSPEPQALMQEINKLNQEKREVTRQYSKDGERSQARVRDLEMTIEELEKRNEEILEEKKREIDELYLKIDALDNKLKSDRQFLDEQVMDREQEREEYQGQIKHLNTVIQDKEKKESAENRLQREVDDLTDELQIKVDHHREIAGRNEQLQLEIADKRLRTQELEDKVRHLDREIDDRVEAEERLQQKISQLEEEAKQDSSASEDTGDSGKFVQSDDLKKKINNLELQLEAKERTIYHEKESLEEELRKARRLEEELTSDKEALQKQVYDNLRQISELKTQLDEFKHRFDPGSSTHIEDLRRQLEDEREAVDRKQKEISDLVGQLEEFREQALDSDEQLHQLTMQLKVTETQLENARSEQRQSVKDILEENNKLESRLRSVRTESEPGFPQSLLDEKNEEIDHLHQELEKLRGDNSADQTDNSAMDKDVATLRQELEDRLKEIEDLKQTIDSLQQSENLLDTTVSDDRDTPLLPSLTHRMSIQDEFSNALSLKDYEVDQLESELERTTAELAQAKLDLEASSKMASSPLNEALLQEKETAIEQLSVQVDSLQTEVNNLTDFQGKLQEDYDMVHAMLEEKQREIETLTKELTETRPQADGATDALMKYELQVEALNKELTEKGNVIDEKEEELYLLNERLEEQESDKSDLEKTLEEKEEELSQLRGQLENNNNDGIQGDIHVSEIERLRGVVQAKENALTELQQQRTKEAEALEKSRTELVKTNEALEDRQAQIDTLTTQAQHAVSVQNGSEGLQDEVTRLTSVLRDLNEEGTEMEQQIRRLKNELEMVGLELEKFKEETVIHQTEAVKKNAELESLKERLRNIETEAERIEELTDELNKTRSQLHLHQAASASTSMMSLEGVAADNQELEKAKEELVNARLELQVFKDTSRLSAAELEKKVLDLQRHLIADSEERIQEIRDKAKLDIQDIRELAEQEIDIRLTELSQRQEDTLRQLRLNHVKELETYVKQVERETEKRLMEEKNLLVQQHQQEVDALRARLTAADDAIVMDIQSQLQSEVAVTERLDSRLLEHLTRPRQDGVGHDNPDISYMESAQSYADRNIPDRLRILMNRLHNEGVQMLTLSELQFLQRHSSPPRVDKEADMIALQSSWENEKQGLLAAVQALKDLLSQMHATKNVAMNGESTVSDWRGELVQAISRVFAKEREILLAELRTHVVASPSTELSTVQRLEQQIRGQGQHHKLSMEQMYNADRQSLLAEIRDLRAHSSITRLQLQDEKQRLSQQLSSTEDQLSKREHHFKRQLELLEFKLKQEEVMLEDVRVSLDAEISRSQELQAQLSRERAQLADLQMEISETEIRADKLQDKLEQEENRVKSISEALDEERTRTSKLKEVVEEENIENHRLQMVLEEEHHKVEQFREKELSLFQTLEKELEKEKDLHAEVENNFEREKLTVENLRLELKFEKDNLYAVENQFKSRLAQLQANLDSERSKVNELNSAIEREKVLNEQLRQSLEEERGSLRATTEREHAILSDLKALLESERGRVAELQMASERDRRHVTSLNVALEEAKGGAQEEVDRERSTCRELKREMDAAQNEKLQLSRQQDSNHNQISNLERERVELMAEIKSLKDTVNEREKRSVTDLRSERKKIREMERERDDDRVRQHESVLEMDRLNHKVKELEGQVSNLTLQIQSQTTSPIRRDRTDPSTGAETSLKEFKARLDVYRKQLESSRQRLQLLMIKHRDQLHNRTESGDTSLRVSIGELLAEVQQLQRPLTLDSEEHPTLAGFPPVSGINDRLMQQNTELTGFVTRLSQEKAELRQTISRLEDEASRYGRRDTEHVHGEVGVSDSRLVAERASWNQERLSLQMALKHAEQDVVRLKGDLRVEQQRVLKFSTFSTECDQDKMHRLYGKYLRAESFRKALIYQKKYLLVLLGGFRDCEEKTLAIIAQMGVYPSREDIKYRSRHSKAYSRFRTAARVIIAVYRMKYLVTKWRRATKVGSPVTTGNSPLHHGYMATASTYSPPRLTSKTSTSSWSPLSPRYDTRDWTTNASSRLAPPAYSVHTALTTYSSSPVTMGPVTPPTRERASYRVSTDSRSDGAVNSAVNRKLLSELDSKPHSYSKGSSPSRRLAWEGSPRADTRRPTDEPSLHEDYINRLANLQHRLGTLNDAGNIRSKPHFSPTTR